MKNIAILSLVVLLMFPTLHKAVVFSDFLINQDYIAKVLCINKEKPILTCNGKCYLAEQITLDTTKKNKFPSFNFNEIKLVYYFKITLFEISNVGTYYLKKLSKNIDNTYNFHYLNQVFHPPQFLQYI